MWLQNEIKIQTKSLWSVGDIIAAPLIHMLFPGDYQPPFPLFFFFCGAFLRLAPDDAGFCCRGGATLLPTVADDPVAEPGLGEVGGLLAVLLASLKRRESQSNYQTKSTNSNLTAF